MDLELVFQTINGKARRKEEEIKQFLMAIQTEKKTLNQMKLHLCQVLNIQKSKVKFILKQKTKEEKKQILTQLK